MKEYRLILTYLVAVLLVLIALICGGCSTTKYVPVETIKRDTVYQSKIEHDSVYLHDSVYVKEWQNGDTIYRDRDRWHTKYVEKEVHDTLYQSKTDSIAVPYPVEKELTWWERKKIEFGELAMVVMAGLLCFVVIKSKLK
jgi:hypothetical protein